MFNNLYYKTSEAQREAWTNMDADAWLAHFQRYIEYRQLSENDVIAILPLFLKEVAIDWYENLPANAKQDQEALMRLMDLFTYSD